MMIRRMSTMQPTLAASGAASELLLLIDDLGFAENKWSGKWVLKLYSESWK